MRNCLVAGVDFNGDIPLVEYEQAPENKSQYMRFFEGLRELEYPLHGLVSDGNPDIYAAARGHFSHFRYQTCLKHFTRSIDRSFGYLTVKRRKLDKEYQSELLLRDQIYSLIWTKKYEDFLNQYHILKRKKLKSENCQRMIAKLKYNLHSIIAHYFDPGLQLTNNLAENFIKQINRRLKLIEGFQNPKTAEGYLRLLVMYLRFKPYTDARGFNKYRNGKSRLELADVDTKNIDWLKFSQKN